MKWAHHRSGWRDVQSAVLERLTHPHASCEFYGELEDALFQTKPFESPWIGVAHQTFHAPAHIPTMYGGRSDLDFLLHQHPNLRLSLPHCRGLFTNSEHVAAQLRKHVSVPVQTLQLPTALDVAQFSLERFAATRQKTIVQLGNWLRRFYPIYDLPVKGYRRIWLAGGDFRHKHALKCEGVRRRRFAYVRCPKHITDQAYDDLLTCSIAVVGLWEANCNNSIVECIARATPVLTNPLPAVKEYLGEDYPFYFQTLDEAAHKLQDDRLIRETTAYLQERRKHLWSIDRFIHELTASDIYTSLPRCDHA
ncbi:hypothetical protein [Aporhodopirellula aestuarii]|uniref:Glycosyltransferase n=1 Tax=Aporhodopirellula aestuarii TaxID=2950107 RepID=A0ABT0U070_9BACT|nr:hypothetical protein [Aporhodopirellula aestuarii]MCM2370252.1 hypothetical protein [Aporhodopirellula aestuarii]